MTEVKERPILFSGPMVRAILDGSKTQTRRVVKPQPDIVEGGTCFIDGSGLDGPDGKDRVVRCPYGQPGERLWVRETTLISPKNFVDEAAGTHPGGRVVQYLASHSDREAAADFGVKKATPSIHMPRWASRITLEVTEVRVERLHQIDEGGAMAEGCVGVMAEKPVLSKPGMDVYESLTARGAYAKLWDSINARRGFGWDVNPWVWVISFRRRS